MSEVHQRDIETAKKMHGDVVVTGGLLNKVGTKDKTLAEKEALEYQKFWDESRTGNEADDLESKRESSYTKLVNAYYNLSTDLYEYGWGTSFHFARHYQNETLMQAVARHEHYLASQLQLKPGQKVLDVGCGVGGPAREIIHFSGAHVTGFNNNAYQLERAAKYAAQAGIADLSGFIKGDFMNMDVPDNTFDAAYAIEATCHAPDLTGVYAEMFRVVKPGGRVAIYEWCSTDKYDATNPLHKKIGLGIQEGDGLPKLYSTKEAEECFKKAGFELETARDLVLDSSYNSVPWYKALEGGDYRDGVMSYLRTKTGKALTSRFVGVLETIGIAPKGTQHMSQVLSLAQDNLVEAGKLGIYTPMFLLVGRKPLA